MKNWVIDKFVRVSENCKEAYRQGEGDSLIDAIRNSGIRCETCEHFTKTNEDSVASWGDCSNQKIGIMDAGYFFCAQHSKLQNEE